MTNTDPKNGTDRFTVIRLFLDAAQLGSFSAAGRKQAVALMGEAEASLHNGSDSVRGVVKISAPSDLGRNVLMPMRALHAAGAGASADIGASDRAGTNAGMALLRTGRKAFRACSPYSSKQRRRSDTQMGYQRPRLRLQIDT